MQKKLIVLVCMLSLIILFPGRMYQINAQENDNVRPSYEVKITKDWSKHITSCIRNVDQKNDNIPFATDHRVKKVIELSYIPKNKEMDIQLIATIECYLKADWQLIQDEAVENIEICRDDHYVYTVVDVSENPYGLEQESNDFQLFNSVVEACKDNNYFLILII